MGLVNLVASGEVADCAKSVRRPATVNPEGVVMECGRKDHSLTVYQFNSFW